MQYLYQTKVEEIGDSLIENVLTKYCLPECIIMYQEITFMSSLINYLLGNLDIKIKNIARYNHQSLHAEHRIKCMSTILTKHLTNWGQM